MVLFFLFAGEEEQFIKCVCELWEMICAHFSAAFSDRRAKLKQLNSFFQCHFRLRGWRRRALSYEIRTVLPGWQWNKQWQRQLEFYCDKCSPVMEHFPYSPRPLDLSGPTVWWWLAQASPCPHVALLSWGPVLPGREHPQLPAMVSVGLENLAGGCLMPDRIRHW